MSAVQAALEQDLEAISQALESNDFTRMNIFANRLTSNGYLVSNGWAAITGYFLKQVAVQALDARKSEDSLQVIQSAGRALIKTLRKLPKSESASGDMWRAYFDYASKARKGLMGEIERESYAENTEFVSICFARLNDILGEYRSFLLKPNNMLMKGILNEASRLVKVHGAEPKEMALHVVWKAFDGYYSFVAQASMRPDGAFDTDLMESAINPRIDGILDAFTFEKSESQFRPSEVDDLLVDLIFEWRRHFILLLEQPMLLPSSERRGVELPEEAKRKITKIIDEALKKEVKTE